MTATIAAFARPAGLGRRIGRLHFMLGLPLAAIVTVAALAVVGAAVGLVGTTATLDWTIMARGGLQGLHCEHSSHEIFRK